jgi:hypothetical protein
MAHRAYQDERHEHHQQVFNLVTRHFQGEGAKAEAESGDTNPYAEFEAAGLSGEDRAELTALARESGIPPADLQEVVKTFFENSGGDRFKPVEPEAALAELTKVWKGERDLNLEITQQFVQERPALGAWLDQTGLGNHSAVVVALHKLASKYQTEGENVEAMMRDPAYLDDRDPRHNALVEKVQRAFARRYAGQKVAD